MINLVVGGQMDKQSIASFLQARYPDQLSLKIASDIEGALAIQNGTADYYVGSCATGAGGALGIALALLGPSICVTLTRPGHVSSPEEIRQHVADGKMAFGFVNNVAEKVLPILIDALLDKAGS